MKKLIGITCLAALLLLPVAPAQADPIVRTEECPEGMVGRTVYVGDNIATRTCYRLP